ncbi:thiol:disulfide interchange protein DsbA/DsbL [Actinobacillus vicugnae]|uniref:thiol:disulfide interchange protein DsbA/DsbL n=1 Tax=Actinobacillus vicugnae TaxID=2573093 RepID=UPI001FCC3C65|nr:thiol:disulfide interchange protein DsbA/DsbL [Actinobacillus vicugnae]
MLFKDLVKWGTVLVISLFALNVFAVSEQAVGNSQQTAKNEPLFKDGKGYYSYKKPINIELPKDGRILIQYFFKYDCAVCLNANDYLKQYAQQHQDKVVLQHSPAYENGDTFTGQMHASFIANGREDLSELYLFDSVGRKQTDSLVKSDAAVAQWISAKGLDVVAFNKLFHSEQVKTRMAQDRTLFNLYNPPYVPIAVLNGKYILL